MSGEDRPDGPARDESNSSPPEPARGAQPPAESGGELDRPAPRFDEEFVLEIDEQFLSSTMDDEDLAFILEDPGELLGSLDEGPGAETPVAPLAEEPEQGAAEETPAEEASEESVAAADGGDFGSMLDELSQVEEGASLGMEEDQANAFEDGYQEALAGVEEMEAEVESAATDPLGLDEVSEHGTLEHLEPASPSEEPAEAPSEDLDTSWFAESADELATVQTTEETPVAEEWAEDLGFSEKAWDGSEEQAESGVPEGMAQASPGEESDEDGDLASVLGVDEDEWPEGDQVSSARSLWIPAVAALVLVGIGFFALQALVPSLFESGETPVDEVATTPDPLQPEPTPVEPDPVVPEPDPLVVDPAPVVAEPPVEPAPVEPDPVVEPPAPPTVVSTSPDPVQVEPGTIPSPEVVSQPPPSVITPEPPPVRVPRPEDSLKVTTTSNQVVELRPGETIVELKNGHFFKGRMKRIRKQRLTLADGMAEYTFHLDEIRILEENSPEYLEFGKLPSAAVTLVNGQRLRGRLLKQTEQHVVLAYESGRLVVPQGEVAGVSFAGRVHF